MPHDTVFDAIERLHRDLEHVREILTGPEASVRLVLTPENVVVAEARRSLTTLSLFGYRVDGVVANRVFPAEGADPWREQWVSAQATVLREVEHSLRRAADLAVVLPALRARRGEQLGEFAAAAYGDDDPLAPPKGTGR